jgi:hypothetical protein
VDVLVRDAREVVRNWVIDEASGAAGFAGTMFRGSIIGMDDDALFPATSDVDIGLFHAGDEQSEWTGKFLHDGLIFEVSSRPIERLPDPDVLLANYHLAGGFRSGSVISDPTGRLSDLSTQVERDFANRQWVERRCEDARANCLGYIERVGSDVPFHERVTAWLFAAGVTTHVILAAGLRNPTVRKRYLAAWEVLAEFGFLDFHESLLELQGSRELSSDQVRGHLTTLAEVFDETAALGPVAHRFSSDISEIARPIAIGGSLELIEQGFHREAVFWIVATYSRCLGILDVAGQTEMSARFQPGFIGLLHDLGIGSDDDLRRRAEQVRVELPQVMDLAGAIMDGHPGIRE